MAVRREFGNFASTIWSAFFLSFFLTAPSLNPAVEPHSSQTQFNLFVHLISSN